MISGSAFPTGQRHLPNQDDLVAIRANGRHARELHGGYQRARVRIALESASGTVGSAELVVRENTSLAFARTSRGATDTQYMARHAVKAETVNGIWTIRGIKYLPENPASFPLTQVPDAAITQAAYARANELTAEIPDTGENLEPSTYATDIASPLAERKADLVSQNRIQALTASYNYSAMVSYAKLSPTHPRHRGAGPASRRPDRTREPPGPRTNRCRAALRLRSA